MITATSTNEIAKMMLIPSVYKQLPKLNESFNHTLFVLALNLSEQEKPVTQSNLRAVLNSLGVKFNNNSLSMRVQAHKWPTFNCCKYVEKFDAFDNKYVEPRTLELKPFSSAMSSACASVNSVVRRQRVVIAVWRAESIHQHGKRGKAMKAIEQAIDNAIYIESNREELKALHYHTYCMIAESMQKSVIDVEYRKWAKRNDVTTKCLQAYCDYIMDGWRKGDHYHSKGERYYHAMDKACGFIIPRLESPNAFVKGGLPKWSHKDILNERDTKVNDVIFKAVNILYNKCGRADCKLDILANLKKRMQRLANKYYKAVGRFTPEAVALWDDAIAKVEIEDKYNVYNAVRRATANRLKTLEVK